MDVEREWAKVAKKLEQVERIDVVHDDLKQSGGLARRHVIALESIQPGILTDNMPLGGFTEEPSDRHYAIALESTSTLRKVLFGAALLALFGWFGKLIANSGMFGSSTSGSSGGGGSGGGGAGRGGGYEANFNREKKKHEDAIQEVIAATDKTRVVADHVSVPVNDALSDSTFEFLESIGTDANVIAGIRSDPHKAYAYFLHADALKYTPFMHDVFASYMSKIAGRLVLTAGNYVILQKEVINTAAIINGFKEERSKLIRKDAEDIMERAISAEDFMHGRGKLDVAMTDRKLLEDRGDNVPKDIKDIRTYFQWDEKWNARTVSAEIRDRMNKYNHPATLPENQYTFKSYADFDARINKQFMELALIGESYAIYISEHSGEAKQIIEETVEALDLLYDDAQEVADEVSREMLSKEFSRLRTHYHSQLLVTQALSQTMSNICRLCATVMYFHKNGWTLNKKAVEVNKTIEERLRSIQAQKGDE